MICLVGNYSEILPGMVNEVQSRMCFYVLGINTKGWEWARRGVFV